MFSTGREILNMALSTFNLCKMRCSWSQPVNPLPSWRPSWLDADVGGCLHREGTRDSVVGHPLADTHCYLHNIYTIYTLHTGCPISHLQSVNQTKAHSKCQICRCFKTHCMDVVAQVPLAESVNSRIDRSKSILFTNHEPRDT